MALHRDQEKQQAHDLQPSRSLKKESNVEQLKQNNVLITVPLNPFQLNYSYHRIN